VAAAEVLQDVGGAEEVGQCVANRCGRVGPGDGRSDLAAQEQDLGREW
jgi:hypothetical protein